MAKGPGPSNKGAVFVVMGPPNAGKGTQTRLLGEHLGAVHFSTGELMRKENDPKIMALTDTGALAPNDYIRDMIARELRSVPDKQAVVIDGAKMLPEAKWLVKFLPTLGRKLDRVVLIQLTESVSRARSASRAHGRQDDAEHVQDVRWERFRTDVVPTIEFYRSLGVLEEVDGSGTQAQVASQIRSALGL
jgi:adenylate kinase